MAATRTLHLTRRERDVLTALCRPAAGSADTFVEPASIRDMAYTLGVSDAAIKQHLVNLYDKFELFDGEDKRRVRLANLVLSTGSHCIRRLCQSGGGDGAFDRPHRPEL